MRLSTQQFFSQNLDTVRNGNAELFKYQQQLASGKKISQASDDPLAATQINKYEHVIARSEVFASNVDVAERRLKLEESTLALVSDSVLRIKDLAIQANNATLNDTDREIVAEELRQILDQLASAANTQDAQGEYLFSGFKGGAPAYALNASDRYEYQGDHGQRFLDIGENNTVASTDPGSAIFGDGTANILNTVKDMIELLDGTTPTTSFSDDISALQGELDQFFEGVVTQRSKLGARLNVLEAQGEALADIKLFTTNSLSVVQDTDYYEATSKLMQQQTALQAAYSSFGQIQQLSLFDYVG
ncbi:flagellar hook-associated protein FlgL [Marinobacterium sp. D7]|uniref:flagellar hook-associated protein FlgL n=1 Tax=Marinobacterium ramblicola TaxID=2849041 RepID=UPI001C2DEE95|nr:flagellar hook-associated protein FlgL [Marinobacterium ramblicola]MBV1788863.1 flagellar hook-associated protein FlgL [Marinobacterium ramblicola]